MAVGVESRRKKKTASENYAIVQNESGKQKKNCCHGNHLECRKQFRKLKIFKIL